MSGERRISGGVSGRERDRVEKGKREWKVCGMCWWKKWWKGKIMNRGRGRVMSGWKKDWERMMG